MGYIVRGGIMKRVVHTVYHTPNRTPTCEPIYVTVGYNIKAWREHLGFTQAELAEEVGIQRTSINNAEAGRSEEHTSELQSPDHLVCRLLLEKKKKKMTTDKTTRPEIQYTINHH